MIVKTKNPYSLLFKILAILPVFLFCLVLFQNSVPDAAELKFAWDPPADTRPDQIGGYYLYWGNESKNYVNRVHLGNVYEATIKELVEGNTYYFATTCYYIEKPDIESDFSNEVAKTVEQPAPSINQPPTADAGQDQTASAGECIFLDGANSSDPNGAIISYSWTQLGGPDVVLNDSESSQASFTLPTEGIAGKIFTFQLTVKNTGGLQSTDTCAVRVSEEIAPPAETGNIDVSGAWGSLKRAGKSGKVFASFDLKNLSNQKIDSITVEIYESEDGEFDPSDHRLAAHQVSNLEAKATIGIGIRVENFASGNRLIAVIDPTDAITEIDEENNVLITSNIK